MSTVDLTKCKPGDKLVSRDGTEFEYARSNRLNPYYSHTAVCCRTKAAHKFKDDGRFWWRGTDDWDIVKVIPAEPEHESPTWDMVPWQALPEWRRIELTKARREGRVQYADLALKPSYWRPLSDSGGFCNCLFYRITPEPEYRTPTDEDALKRPTVEAWDDDDDEAVPGTLAAVIEGNGFPFIVRKDDGTVEEYEHARIKAEEE
jgi:hypothetical protein